MASLLLSAFQFQIPPLLGRQQFLCAAKVDRNQTAHALFDHGDAEQPVHAAHGDGVVRHDQVTCVRLACHGVEQVAEPLDIRIVKRRIDFIEDADRRGVGKEQCKDQCNGRERLFPA